MTAAKKGKPIGIRADIDALPVTEETGLVHCSVNNGLMHACGHDSHTTMLLGAAKLLCQNKYRLSGRVKFIFQQAEELVSGAVKMIEAGVLDDVDEIIGLHVVPTLEAGRIETKKGAALASSDMYEIKVFGKRRPWLCSSFVYRPDNSHDSDNYCNPDYSKQKDKCA